jgi:hypothetical protein
MSSSINPLNPRDLHHMLVVKRAIFLVKYFCYPYSLLGIVSYYVEMSSEITACKNLPVLGVQISVELTNCFVNNTLTMRRYLLIFVVLLQSLAFAQNVTGKIVSCNG